MRNLRRTPALMAAGLAGAAIAFTPALGLAADDGAQPAQKMEQKAPRELPPVGAQEGQRLTVTGRIQASEMGETRVEIVSPQEGRFLIDDQGKGSDLADHVGETVTLTGTLKTDQKGVKVIQVQSFSLRKG